MDRKACLETALAAVYRRSESYGAPERNFEVIADMWTVYLRHKLDIEGLTVQPIDVAMMLNQLKVARTIGDPLYEDNYTDGAGYMACGAEIAEAMKNAA